MGGVDKLLVRIGDHSVLWHALYAFYRTGRFSEVVMVTSEQRFSAVIEECSDWKWVVRRVPGGARRQDSVVEGLKALNAGAEPPDFVAIHDGARPCLDDQVIPRVLDSVEADGAAVAALPVADTLRSDAGDGWAGETVNRDGVWRMQTPQAFRFSWIMDAYQRIGVGGEEHTDDVAIARRAGYRVKLVPGSNLNFKLTIPEDVELARRICRGSQGETDERFRGRNMPGGGFER
jgi:2-C-methyl-D-erythritol 4-phosphate cytidylyltransferase